MNNIILILFVLALAYNAEAADKELLTPEPLRITDEAIATDTKAMQGVQKRLADLNKKGIPIASYHFAKAQAWLDFALEAYTMNDRSHAAEEALQQAVSLVKAMEKGEKDIPLATPVIPASEMIRPDLWERAEKLKKQKHFLCAADKVAQLEVQLVWAGLEEKELGWRHAKPYLQAAERLAREAAALAAKPCPPPLPPAEPETAKPKEKAGKTKEEAAKPGIKNEPDTAKPEIKADKPETGAAPKK